LQLPAEVYAAFSLGSQILVLWVLFLRLVLAEHPQVVRDGSSLYCPWLLCLCA